MSKNNNNNIRRQPSSSSSSFPFPYRQSYYYYYYFIAAAAATAIAGILPMILAYNVIGRNINSGIFFIVAGLAQLFWVLPMVKRWGRIWYYIGITGTIILMIIYAITRVPNPITGGRALPINDMGVATMVLEAVYIGITALIIAKDSTCSRPKRRRAKIIKKDLAMNLYHYYCFKSILLFSSSLTTFFRIMNLFQILLLSGAKAIDSCVSYPYQIFQQSYVIRNPKRLSLLPILVVDV